MSDTITQITRVFDQAANLASRKNEDYGDAWREQGWRGNLARVLSKTARIRNMFWKRDAALLNGSRETVRETALDLINTLAFMIVNMDDGREWGHEDTRFAEFDSKPITGSFDAPPLPRRTPQPVPAMAGLDMSATQEFDAVQVPTPGEEDPDDKKPSPRRRVKDAPQA